MTVQKRNLLMERIALFCTGVSAIHFFLDFSQGVYYSALFDAVLVSVIFFCFILNRLKFHLLAKCLVLVFLNVFLAIYANLIPGGIGIYLYYFPLIVASYALFGPDEKKFRHIFTGLSFSVIVLLLTTDFNFLGLEHFPGSGSNARTFFIINCISSVITMMMCINFILSLNELSENQLQTLAEEIKAKNDDLERTNQELDRFLYSTSHDLRSPLSSIKGLIHVARYDTTDKKILNYFNMMTDRVDRLEHFIKDIIDYSKNERTEVHQEVVDFNALVDEVNDTLKFVDGASSIEFKKEVDLHYDIYADKTRLSVVLHNLMANAVKYHDPRKEHQWIRISISNSNHTLKLVVSDNGSGIAEEHQERIFDMFYRGTLKSTGSGLGLYIVKQAIAKMEGTIRVQSEVGQGTSFFIEVPVSEPGIV